MWSLGLDVVKCRGLLDLKKRVNRRRGAPVSPRDKIDHFGSGQGERTAIKSRNGEHQVEGQFTGNFLLQCVFGLGGKFSIQAECCGRCWKERIPLS